LPRGAAGQALAAARETAQRLNVWPPVDRMGLRQLREYVVHVHEEHVAKGGTQTIPAELRAHSRAELEDILRRLKGVSRL
jgi:hypothetical protein